MMMSTLQLGFQILMAMFWRRIKMVNYYFLVIMILIMLKKYGSKKLIKSWIYGFYYVKEKRTR